MADHNLWRDRSKVFVAGLPSYVDDDGLYEFFRPCGDMFQSKVVYDAKTGRSKGFGFLTFCEYLGALEAVNKMNGTKWDQRVLNVRFLTPKSDANATTPGDSAGAAAESLRSRAPKVLGPCPEGCTSIYVGNLAYDITEDILRKVFESHGDIKAIRFAENITTKEFRGFGYVQFYSSEPCTEAVKMDGMIVMGRPMNVDYGARDEATEQARESLQKKLKKGICHKFQAGNCTRGDECKFAHVQADQVDADDEHAHGSSSIADQGASSFEDSGDSNEQEPAAPVVVVTAADADAVVCMNFQKGKCKRGAACRFRHVTEAEVPNNSSSKTELEENAPNTHENPAEQNVEKDTDSSAPLCLNFQKGKCKRGSACRFRHAASDGAGESEVSDAPRYEKKPSNAVVHLPTISVCRNFAMGRCTRGASCRFAHTAGSGIVPGAAVVAVPGAQIATIRSTQYQQRFQSICYNWQRNGSCVRGDQCPFEHDGAPISSTASSATKSEAFDVEMPETEASDVPETSEKKHHHKHKDHKRKSEHEDKTHKKHRKSKEVDE